MTLPYYGLVMTRTLAILLVVVLAVASAIYLTPAAIDIVSWSAHGPRRIALLPPLARWWWSLGGVAAGVGAAAFLAERRKGLDVLAAAISPLALLALWVVPFLPWLPDRAPALLALAGPMRWIVAAVAFGGALSAAAQALGWTRPLPWRPGRYLVFTVSLAMYLTFGLMSAAAVGPGADEPHYLVITQSLLLDHDLDIENNHLRNDYRAYYEGELRPDYLVRGVHGTIYSIHAPGLPALLVPAYAAAGYHGAVVFLAMLAAMTALAVFDLASALTGPRGGTFTWLAVCFTVPFMPQSWLIFPELPGALLAAWAARWMWEGPNDGARRWFLRGLALAWLPWLHTKFSILLALFSLCLAIRLWPRIRPIVALAIPIAASSALWLCSFYWMYGTFDPQAPYGEFARAFVTLSNIPRGLVGLLFDQKFGLLVYSPVYVLAAAGVWPMLRRRELRRFGLGLIATIGAFALSSTRMYMWWGGSSAPARFLVPLLPLAAPFIAVAYNDLRSPTARALTAALTLASIALAVAAASVPDRLLVFSAPHGVSTLLQMLGGSAPLTPILPTFTEEDWPRPLSVLAPWLLAGGLGWLSAWFASGRGRTARLFWIAIAGGVTFFAAGSTLAARYAPPVRAAAVVDGQIDLMARDDPARLQAVNLSTLHRLPDAEMVGETILSFRREFHELNDDARLLAGPVSLPAGQYHVRVWFDGDQPRDSDLVLTSGRSDELSRQLGPLPNPATAALTIPVDIPRLSVGLTTARDAGAVRRIEIIADAIVPESARPRIEMRAIEPIGGDKSAFIVYADLNTYPEGGIYWTKGTRLGQVDVFPGRASTILLTLHVGPLGGDVRLRAGDRSLVLPMAHDETRQISIPVPPGAGFVPVSVQAAREFRPADIDHTSRDFRHLGCQVRVELQP